MADEMVVIDPGMELDHQLLEMLALINFLLVLGLSILVQRISKIEEALVEWANAVIFQQLHAVRQTRKDRENAVDHALNAKVRSSACIRTHPLCASFGASVRRQGNR